MIVRNKTSWLRMVFAVRGSSISTTWPRIAVVTAFAILVTWAYRAAGLESYSLTTTPLTLIGTAMAIFLGFRNSEAYDRFWEGRKLWGALVNVSRSFTRQTLTLVVAPSEAERAEVHAIQQKLVRMMIAYVHAFRHHLRNSDPFEQISQYLSSSEMDELKKHSNVPNALVQQMGQLVHEAWQSGYVRDYHVPILEGSLTEITSIQGGCERIKSTPIPFEYSVLIHRIVAVYCFAMPFGLVSTTGVLTPIVVFFISYAFFGLDAIGDDVEEPFQLDANDLPLDAISRTIEINLLQIVGAKDVPAPHQPINNILT